MEEFSTLLFCVVYERKGREKNMENIRELLNEIVHKLEVLDKKGKALEYDLDELTARVSELESVIEKLEVRLANG